MIKTIYYKNKKFDIFPDVYEPAEDSFLLAENLTVKKDAIVLDMGCGCGFLGILATDKAKQVVGVDNNPQAVACAKHNVQITDLTNKIKILYSDLFSALNTKFDLILFNPPYLPTVKTDRVAAYELEKAWDGGPIGRKIID